MNNTIRWVTKKPKFNKECLVICASKFIDTWEYSLYQIKWIGLGNDLYLGWLTIDGEEYGDLNDMKAEKYLVIDLLK